MESQFKKKRGSYICWPNMPQHYPQLNCFIDAVVLLMCILTLHLKMVAEKGVMYQALQWPCQQTPASLTSENRAHIFEEQI